MVNKVDDDIDYENMFDMDTFIWAIEVHEDANEDESKWDYEEYFSTFDQVD